MPNVITFLPFFLVTFYICFKKLNLLGRLSDVLFLPTLIGLVLIISLSVPNADLQSFLRFSRIGSVFSGCDISEAWAIPNPLRDSPGFIALFVEDRTNFGRCNDFDIGT